MDITDQIPDAPAYVVTEVVAMQGEWRSLQVMVLCKSMWTLCKNFDHVRFLSFWDHEFLTAKIFAKAKGSLFRKICT